MSAPNYYACPNCWHTMAEYQIASQGTDECPGCRSATMKSLARLDIPAPAIGTKLLCLVCALDKPWGIFDSTTGMSVCVECRDKARAVVPEGVSGPEQGAAGGHGPYQGPELEQAATDVVVSYALGDFGNIVMPNAIKALERLRAALRSAPPGDSTP